MGKTRFSTVWCDVTLMFFGLRWMSEDWSAIHVVLRTVGRLRRVMMMLSASKDLAAAPAAAARLDVDLAMLTIDVCSSVSRKSPKKLLVMLLRTAFRMLSRSFFTLSLSSSLQASNMAAIASANARSAAGLPAKADQLPG